MEENNKKHNKENKKKYVLFSPVGKNDPIDHKGSEGSMLHIIRHYKPDKVYLYITKKLNDKYDICEEKIKASYPDCIVEKINSKFDKNDNDNDYDFIHEFKEIIEDIYKKNKDCEILLNVSCGNPQISNILLFEAIDNYNIKLIPIQVKSPDYNTNETCKSVPITAVCPKIQVKSPDNTNETDNRCTEAKETLKIFKRRKIQSQIESLIKNYEYSAAHELFSKNQDISELFGDDLLKYLHHASLRISLKFEEANKIIEFCNDKNLKKKQQNEFLEYYYVMKVKHKKGELSDFILRITPFATDLLFYYLKNTIEELKTVLIESEDGKKISTSSSAGKELKEKLKDYRKVNFKKKDNYISLYYLIEIKNYYKYNKGINISEDINNLFDDLKNIEKEVRNKVAHTMINITKEFIEEKVGLSKEKILQKNEELLKKVLEEIDNIKIENINFVYDEINKEIKDLLQKPKE